MTDDEFEIAAAVMEGDDNYWGQKLVAEVRHLRDEVTALGIWAPECWLRARH